MNRGHLIACVRHNVEKYAEPVGFMGAESKLITDIVGFAVVGLF